MPTYRFEFQIETLAKNAVSNISAQKAEFDADGVQFSQWDFNLRDGWLGDAWLASVEIPAASYPEAHKLAFSKLNRTVPRITFVAQCYAEYISQSYLAIRLDQQIGFFKYTRPRSAVGLMFMEAGQQALNLLLHDPTIPDEFFYYWNDATNTVGYPGKLLLMFCALEALVKVKKREKDFVKLEQILGTELKEKLFGIKGASSTGLRHRLIHGEYFGEPDSGRNYLDEVHKKVLAYFNDEVLKAPLLELNVVSPQRHFYGNREECRLFIAPREGALLDLKSLLRDFNEHGINNFRAHESVLDEQIHKRFWEGL